MIYLTDAQLAELCQKNGITSAAAQEAADSVKNTSITIIYSSKKCTRTVHNGIVSLKWGCPFQKMALKSLILTSLLPEAEEAYGIDLGDNFYAKWSRDTNNLVGGLSFKLPDEISKKEEKAPVKPDDDDEL